jgi:hypothetical protein
MKTPRKSADFRGFFVAEAACLKSLFRLIKPDFASFCPDFWAQTGHERTADPASSCLRAGLDARAESSAAAWRMSAPTSLVGARAMAERLELRLSTVGSSRQRLRRGAGRGVDMCAARRARLILPGALPQRRVRAAPFKDYRRARRRRLTDLGSGRASLRLFSVVAGAVESRAPPVGSRRRTGAKAPSWK